MNTKAKIMGGGVICAPRQEHGRVPFFLQEKASKLIQKIDRSKSHETSYAKIILLDDIY